MATDNRIVIMDNQNGSDKVQNGQVAKASVSSQSDLSPEETIEFLTPDQVQEIQKYFDMFDKEHTGYINVSQIGQILKAMGQTYDEKELNQLLKEIDSDHDHDHDHDQDESDSEFGELDFRDFLELISKLALLELDEEDKITEESFKDIFKIYDKEQNGYINMNDLREILREMDETITEEELEQLIEEVDADGSGTIDFDGTTFWLFILNREICFSEDGTVTSTHTKAALDHKRWLMKADGF